MGKRILDYAKEFKLLHFFILAILLFGLDKLLCSILLGDRSGFLSDNFYLLIERLFGLCFFIIWISLYTWYLKERSYAAATGGRSLRYDQKQYKRSYHELKEYFQDADPHKLDLDVFPDQEWRDASGIIFGKSGNKLIKIDSDSEANIAVFGAPGSKKTSGVAIPSASRFKGSVLAVDIKGDLYNYNRYKRPILRFCPDVNNPLRDSCHFNPFKGINEMTETERKIYIENMALVLIPDEGGSDGNYFTSRARKFFQGITHYLLYLNPNTSFPNVLHAILHPGKYETLPRTPFQWVETIISSNCLAAKEQVASMLGNNEKNISGTFDCLCTALIPFSNEILDVLLTGKGPCIDMDALDDGYDCYLQIKQENLDAYAPLFTLILQSLITGFTSRPDTSTGARNRPILMLLDECPQLTFSFKQLNSSLSTLRSKSIICMLIAQSKAQLEIKYGDAGARAILGNCTYQLILSCIDATSQKYFSELIGTKKVLKVSNSISSENNPGKSVLETREPIFRPEDFGDLKDNLVIYYNGKYTLAKKISCYEP